MSTIDTTLFFNQLMSTMLKKIIVPDNFSGQADVIEVMLRDDVSGLVDSLTDFAVESATVDYGIETDNETLNKILKKWLKQLNRDYKGKVPSGIKPLAKEYFKERWKGASFPVLKITKWGNFDGIQLPSRLFFVDGGGIVAKEKDKKNTQVTLFSYDYYLGDIANARAKLDKGTIFSRPYGRWFDKYPVPYLIKRGVYHNYRIIKSLKELGKTVLEEVIPYLLIIKKGSAELTQQGKTYSDTELKQVYEDIQNLLREYQTHPTRDAQTKVRATDYAEEIKHLIPDLGTVFAPKLYMQAERNILSGLGFIDVVQGISDNRKESIINPKAFVEEIRAGVEDFKQVMFQLVLLIMDANSRNKKYMTKDFNIVSSPVRSFMTDKFKQELRLLWKNGVLSSKTYCEMVGEVEFDTEVTRRKKEAKDGIDTIMYPHMTDNKEADVTPEEQKKLDKNGNPIPDDKLNQRENFDLSGLELAPYNNPADLPPRIKNHLSPGLQRTFINAFNSALHTYHSETRAFRVAWSVIRKIARKNSKGIWVRKQRRAQGKLVPVKITKGMITNILEKEDKVIIKEALELKKLENEGKKSILLNQLIEKKNKEK